jgi:tryptophan synthase alpha chain
VYLVSRAGVTGERSDISSSAEQLVAQMRAITTLPLAVGFGISTAEQVAQVGSIADGVVVGSALVRTVEQYGAAPDLASRLETFTRELASGIAQRAHS